MAAIYQDHNVAGDAALFLRESGHDVRTAADILMERASDDEQLLVAARNNWVLVTNNVKDFILLHQAWHRWPREWNLAPQPHHGGILLTRQDWPANRLAGEVNAFFALGLPTANRLYQWHGTRGWVLHDPDETATLPR